MIQPRTSEKYRCAGLSAAYSQGNGMFTAAGDHDPRETALSLANLEAGEGGDGGTGLV